jgi:polyisoprenoid-binding protein YceI
MNNARKSPIRRALAVGGAALLLVGAAVGTGAYNLLKPTAAASTPIAAVPLATNSVDLPVTTDASDGASATPAIYEIQPADSQASFTIDEVLRGSPKTVVGTTDQVSGQIAFDSSDPSSAQVGTILIDARTLATDDSSRNRVLNNQILSTDQYEYISFTTSQISGLPETVTAGQPFTFQIGGDLTIRGATRPATFDVTVTPAEDGTLSGSATTTIQYSDWGISIPSVPFVAGVGNQVVLQLNFAATAAA